MPSWMAYHLRGSCWIFCGSNVTRNPRYVSANWTILNVYFNGKMWFVNWARSQLTIILYRQGNWRNWQDFLERVSWLIIPYTWSPKTFASHRVHIADILVIFDVGTSLNINLHLVYILTEVLHILLDFFFYRVRVFFRQHQHPISYISQASYSYLEKGLPQIISIMNLLLSFDIKMLFSSVGLDVCEISRSFMWCKRCRLNVNLHCKIHHQKRDLCSF